jgi:hypothetical protein
VGVAAVARDLGFALAAAGFGAVRGLGADQDEFRIELRRDEVAGLFVPFAQGERRIVVVLDLIVFGEAKHPQRHVELDAERDVLPDVAGQRPRHHCTTVSVLAARVMPV